MGRERQTLCSVSQKDVQNSCLGISFPLEGKGSNDQKGSHELYCWTTDRTPICVRELSLEKKIPVLYGNVLFKEHPEGQQQSPRLSATSMCPLQSNDWR
ncbi:hypothetical protein Anapl_02608 [Anas platyrhynchos]|uniref:Uncharacterized protein n=1 Tax=Anas platyrhynchos TaxID=8839 RepID=R0M0M9_ANAPL|nr:hypothetical protein Anapl_02608 [Anas platyrhynchos]